MYQLSKLESDHYFCSLLFFQVQTNYDRVGENQFLITIPEADNINHIVVFLTGNIAFPDGYAGLGKSVF